MTADLEVFLLGDLRVVSSGNDVVLPASRKARALLAFLVATGRPHRRERLCDLLWDLPNDPRAALRWALTKLRNVVDTPGRSRIAADRERVAFVKDCVRVDTHQIYARLAEAGAGVPFADLEVMAGQLEGVFLDGLDNAGDDDFAAWLMAEREDARLARLDVLRRLAAHPDAGPAADKWRKLWRAADPSANIVDDSAAPSNRSQNKPAGRPAHAVRARRNALKSQRIGFCEAEDGAKIAFASVGDGPPLLKAANWLNHLEFDWASPIWGRSFADMTLILSRDQRRRQRGWAYHVLRRLGRITGQSMLKRRNLKRLFIITVTGIVPAVIVLLFKDPVKVMSASGIIAAVHTPFIVITALLVNLLRLPRALRPNLLYVLLMAMAGLFYLGFAAVYFWSLGG